MTALAPNAAAAEATPPNVPETRQSFAVAAWRLIKGEDAVLKNRTTFHWCTKDHQSDDKKHNGMYCTHTDAGHDAWRARIDKRKENKAKQATGNTGAAVAPDAKPASAATDDSKKLALSNSLRTALLTHAGLSNDLYDKIWA